MAGVPAVHRIGLALGGGAAHGFAHIPILESFDELGLRPAEIVGTSMGAIIGAAYASGMTGAEIRAYALDVFHNRPAFLNRLWQLRPRRLSEIAFGIGPYDLERVLRAFLPATLPEEFSGLGIPLRAVATDFYGGREIVLSEGPLLPAIAASAAIPMLFRPVIIGGRVMFDGGVCNPVPFDLLSPVDFVVAVDVIAAPSGYPEASSRPDRAPGGLESLIGGTALLMRSLIAEKLKANRRPDIFIRPPTGSANVLDFTKAAAIIRAAEQTKDDIKRKLAKVLAG
jgi:NTE family protein